MLNNDQRAIIRAYVKAQTTLKSHAVVFYDFGNNDSDYLVLPCDELWTSNRCRQENHHVVNWMHPHITPYWEDYGILENEFLAYINRRFPSLNKQEFMITTELKQFLDNELEKAETNHQETLKKHNEIMRACDEMKKL